MVIFLFIKLPLAHLIPPTGQLFYILTVFCIDWRSLDCYEWLFIKSDFSYSRDSGEVPEPVRLHSSQGSGSQCFIDMTTNPAFNHLACLCLCIRQ